MTQKTLLSSNNVGGPATTASTVEYWTPGAGPSTSTTTEANAQVKLRSPGTMSNFYVRIGSNTGTHVFRTRKNGSNGNQTVTVNALGVFEDNSNTDTIAAADLYCYTTDSASNSTTWWTISNHFASDNDTVSICVSWIQTSQATASTNWFSPLTSRYNSNTTTETFMKTRMRKAGTLRYFGSHVQTMRATTTNIRSRKNGANANSIVALTGGGGAGFYEDTTNTDTVTAGEDWNYVWTTGTGSDTLQINHMKCEFISTNGDGVSVSGDPTGGATTDNNTNFYPFGGRCVNTATENATKIKVKAAFDISNVGCMVSQNDVSSASTFKLRKNGADVTNTVSITGSTTGQFTDTTHTDTVADGDELNDALVVPAVAGTHTVTLTQTWLSTTLPVLTRVTKEGTHLYDIIGRITKELTAKYDIVGRITKELIAKYDDFQRIAKEYILKYDIFQRIAKEITALYDIVGRIVKEYIFKYDIAQRISKELTAKYDDFQRIAKEYIFKYDIFQRIAKEITALYDIIGRIAKEYIFKYDIAQRITKELTSLYDIFQRIAKEYIFKYDIFQRISKELTSIYDIFEIGLERITKELIALYDISQRISKEGIFKYDIFQRISKELTSLYDIFTRIFKEGIFKYDVFQRLSKECTVVYDIFQRIFKEGIFKYDIFTRIFKEYIFKYDILGRVTKEITAVYDIISDAIFHIEREITLLYKSEKSIQIGNLPAINKRYVKMVNKKMKQWKPDWKKMLSKRITAIKKRQTMKY